MTNFSIKKENNIWKKVFKKIPWFYHSIFLLFGILIALLFQLLYLKTWHFPYFFIFIIATLMIYALIFIFFSPLIKQNWFWRSNSER